MLYQKWERFLDYNYLYNQTVVVYIKHSTSEVKFKFITTYKQNEMM